MTSPSVDWLPAAEAATPSIRIRHRVTALLVNRNGKNWLARTLRGIAEQTVAPDHLIIADLASDDGSEKLLSLLEQPHLLLRLPADMGISGALDAAEAAAEASDEMVEWLWLLHDDSAPEALALAELLAAADLNPRAAVIGAKVVDWRNPDHVLEVGTAFSAIGTRLTGLEHGERDQGQHDSIQPVMAVSSAGMLVRRETWRALAGFNTELDHFRTDTEFCLRVWESGSEVIVAPRARIRHAQATARGLRRVEGHRGSAHFIDRYAGLLLALSRTRRQLLWLRWLLIALAGAVRTIAYLLLQDVRGARDEVSATAAALLNRRKVLALRRTAGSAAMPGWLRPDFRSQVSHLGTELLSTAERLWQQALDWLLPQREHVSDVGFWNAFSAALRRPGAYLSMASIAAGLWLIWPAMGDGQLVLANGETVPDDAATLWQEYTAGWHAVGFGSTAAAHPLQGWVGMLSLLFGGAAGFMRLTLVLGIWAAGLSMHLALRRILLHAPTRVWLAALYAFSPPVLVAVAAGDVGTVWAAVLLPLLFELLSRIATSRRAMVLAAIVFSVIASVWPVLWLLSVAVVLVAVLRVRPPRWLAMRWLLVPLWAFALDLPWSAETLAQPARWFHQFGVSQTGEAIAAAAVLGIPDRIHGFGWWWSAALLAIAVAAWMDKRNRQVQTGLWLLLFGIAATALAGQLIGASRQTGDWQPSLSLAAVASVGLLIATTSSAASFVRVKLSRAEFGWRQLAALTAIALVALMPIASMVTASQIDPAERIRLQPPVAAETLRGFTEDLRLRTLWLHTTPAGQVSAELLDGRALQFGDLAVADESDRSTIAAAIVSWLTRSESDSANPLRPYGIGYIATPFGDSVTRRVAAMGGMKRLVTARNANLFNVWQLNDVQSRAYIGTGIDEGDLLPDISAAPTTPQVRGMLVARTEKTDLVLADRSNPGWSATLAGQPLKQLPTAELRWQLPADRSGRLNISFAGADRLASLLGSGLAWLLGLLLLAPRRPHAYRDEWLDES